MARRKPMSFQADCRPGLPQRGTGGNHRANPNKPMPDLSAADGPDGRLDDATLLRAILMAALATFRRQSQLEQRRRLRAALGNDDDAYAALAEFERLARPLVGW